MCHGWKAHDGLNQKWRVEEGAIKSNFNDLVIDTQPPTAQEVSMRGFKENSPTQRWYFIPEKALDDFKLLQADPNPLNKAQFWKSLADNYLDVIIGYSIGGYKAKVREASKIIDECASKLDGVAKDAGIARVAGGGGAVTGGVMALVGLGLAPFTVGLSLGLTAAGAAVGVAGSLKSFISSMVNQQWDKSERNKVNEATAPLFRATLSLQGFLNEYIKNLKEAAEFLKTPEGEVVAKEAYNFTEVAGTAGNIAWNAYKVGNTVITTAQQAKQARQIKALVDFIQADYYALNGARLGLATQAAAPGVTVPLLGKTLISAGTASAKVFSGSMAVFGVAFGIWDIVAGAKSISNGSELAKEFRKSSKDLEKESSKLIELYKELYLLA